MDKTELRQVFEKTYADVDGCINHLSHTDKMMIYNLAYTMFLQGAMTAACGAELLPHDEDFFPQV